MRQECYRTINGHALHLDLFVPEEVQARGAVLFFHGGGWNRGAPDAFHAHCKILAARGMVCASATYRLMKHTATDVRECISDARAAVAWMRTHATELGFDPEMLAASGGSAGGHLAACTGIIPDNTWPTSKPNALILFNPVVDQGPGGFGFKRIGEGYYEVSPIHRINKDCPPCCFMLGTEDDGIPFDTGIQFQKRIQAAGGRCDLHLYGGQSHGFFQPDRERYLECNANMLAFLEGLGYFNNPD